MISHTLSTGRRFSRRLPLPALLLVLSFIHPTCTVHSEPRARKAEVENPRTKVVRLGAALIGLPYQYGGSDITGFDCSGFVHYVFHCHGVEVPRTAKKQGRAGRRVDLRKARAGDILVFKLKGGWHSGVLIDAKSFVHAPQTGTLVRRENLSRYWLARLRAVINVLDD